MDYTTFVAVGDRILMRRTAGDDSPRIGLAEKVMSGSIEAITLAGDYYCECLYHPDDPMLIERPTLVETEEDIWLFELVASETRLHEVAAKQRQQDELLMEMSINATKLARTVDDLKTLLREQSRKPAGRKPAGRKPAGRKPATEPKK